MWEEGGSGGPTNRWVKHQRGNMRFDKIIGCDCVRELMLIVCDIHSWDDVDHVLTMLYFNNTLQACSYICC